MAKQENVQILLHEECGDKIEETNVTYEELLKEVDLMETSKVTVVKLGHDTATANMDDYIALEMNYQTNYIKKELERIADYYGISKRKKRKNQLIEEIVIFEKDPENFSIVHRRKRLWFYIEEIKSDNYLSKFLILD